MSPRIMRDTPGRPITGAEPKEKMIKFRIEPRLLMEFRLVCQQQGDTLSEGIRKGMILYIKNATYPYR